MGGSLPGPFKEQVGQLYSRNNRVKLPRALPEGSFSIFKDNYCQADGAEKGPLRKDRHKNEE